MGYIGLISAAERFDPTKGNAFSSFAIPYIKGEMLHFLRDRANAVRIPRRLHQLSNAGTKVSQALIEQLGRQPNDHEIAAALNIDVTEWRSVKLASLNRTTKSLDAGIQSGQQTERTLTLADTLIDPHSDIYQIHHEECLELRHALTQLESKTREMIESVFLGHLSRQEVAICMGVSPGTVTRRIKKGIEQLTEMLQMPALGALVEG